VSGNLQGRVSLSLHDVTVDEALIAVLRTLGYTYQRYGGIVVVSSPSTRVQRPSPSPTPVLTPTLLNITVISADRAAATLHQLYPHDQVSVDHHANAVIVVASPEDVQSMRTILQRLDVKNPIEPTIEAMQLRLAKPSDLVAELRPLYPNARIAVGPNKSLLVAASPQDMIQIKAIVTSLDTPTITPAPTTQPADAVKVTQASPQDVARAIVHEYPGVRASIVGSSVVISGPPDAVSQAKALVALIDQPGAGMKYIQVYHLRFVDAKSVGDLISRSFPGAQVAVDEELNALSIRATTSDQQRIAEAVSQLDVTPGAAVNPAGGPSVQQPGAVANAVGPGGTNIEIVSLKAAAPGVGGAPSTSASDISTTVLQALQQSAPDLRITVPPNSTQLVLTGSPYSIKLARDMINQLDVTQKLVVLDTEILEVDETVAKDLGISTSPIIATTYSEITPQAPPSGGTPPPILGLQPFTRTTISFAAALHLLLQKGQARILADPRITTISGRTATIRAGDNISILTTTGGGPGTIATTQLQTFQRPSPTECVGFA
jgi:type II secretory pathway component GspD/PulD (secretin)